MTIYVGPVCRNKTHRSCPNRIFACTMTMQVARLHAAFLTHSLLYYVDVGALCRPKKGGVGWSTDQSSWISTVCRVRDCFPLGRWPEKMFEYRKKDIMMNVFFKYVDSRYLRVCFGAGRGSGVLLDTRDPWQLAGVRMLIERWNGCVHAWSSDYIWIYHIWVDPPGVSAWHVAVWITLHGIMRRNAVTPRLPSSVDGFGWNLGNITLIWYNK